VWGPYGRNWDRLKKATSRHFLRGRIPHGPDDTTHDLDLRGKGRRSRRRRPLLGAVLRAAFAGAAAAFLVAACWRLTKDASMSQSLLVPFAVVGIIVTWMSDLSRTWKLALSIPLLVCLLPLLA